jgi:hypothetical protein
VKRLRLVVLYFSGSQNATLSYQLGWPEQLARDPRFDVDRVNLARRGDRLALRVGGRRRLDRADAVVMLHSVFSNECTLPPALLPVVAGARPPKVFFIGNEYKLMPEKMRFAEETGTALLVSQLSSAPAHALYRERLGCEVVGIPNTGFDAALFAPRVPAAERPIAIGYRSFASPLYLGHDERRELADRVGVAAERHGLLSDISLSPAARFDVPGWAGFLNRCRSQIGTEAGGDYFELMDETRHRVNHYLASQPDATFTDVHARFFAGRPAGVSGRALSGRVVEAAATKTVQLLLEGDYGGLFLPDVHYIPVRKDFANLDEALGRLRDDAACAEIAENAYHLVQRELSYSRLIDRFRAALEPVLERS